ncbi:MAG TPA: hypothetical protein VJB57_19415 [Dehalococcoidia bacterium]|nr:hypothetical protein [Dehalococcoidia bacterium]
MATAYVFDLDGYEFPRGDVPARGPFVEFSPQRWSEQDVLGTAAPGTILTMIGTQSQRWTFVSHAVTATKDKLLAVYNGQVAVTLKTPQNTTGFSVIMTRLVIQYAEPIENGKFLCEFELMAR